MCARSGGEFGWYALLFELDNEERLWVEKLVERCNRKAMHFYVICVFPELPMSRFIATRRAATPTLLFNFIDHSVTNGPPDVWRYLISTWATAAIAIISTIQISLLILLHHNINIVKKIERIPGQIQHEIHVNFYKEHLLNKENKLSILDRRPFGQTCHINLWSPFVHLNIATKLYIYIY